MTGRRKLHLVAVDPETGHIDWHCAGPNAAGACHRIAVGDIVPCVGHILVRVDDEHSSYRVPPGMTLCPVTLLLATAAESTLLPN